MLRILKISLLLTILFLTKGGVVLAADFTIRPILIDESLEPRDVVTRDITLTNELSRKVNLYATVNEVTIDEVGQIQEFISPIMTDRKVNAASWVEITRGRISLDPGESTTTPVTFRINPQAETGEYNVFIGFTDTNKRFIAEEAALAGNARGIPVKITLGENISTALAITEFKISRFVFTESRRGIDLVLTNNGEVTETPKGEIIFYNSRGEELTATVVNEGNLSINPGETLSLPATVPVYKTIGRFKANVTVTYGKDGQLNAFDTTEFFIIPIYMLILMLAFIVLFSIFVTYLLKRAFDEHRIIDEEEVNLPLKVNTGYVSKDKDHDITLSKK